MVQNDERSVGELIDKINLEYPTSLKTIDVMNYIQKLYPERRMVSDRTIAVTIFHLLRERNEARSFREFAALTGIDLRYLTKYYKMFVAENKMKYCLPTPDSFIKRYSTRLNLPTEIEKTAFDYLEKLKATEDYNIFTAHQCSSALVVLACGSHNHRVLKRDMINTTSLTQPTIKLYCKRISGAINIEYRDIIVDRREKKQTRENELKSIKVEKCVI